MSTPSKDVECIIAMYDSYAKTVMRNHCRNMIKAKRRRLQHEVPASEQVEYLFEMQSHTDIYPSEHFTIGDNSFVCVITSEKLYRAMCLLPEGQRDVLILDFWFGWKDERIARYLHITTRTVYNWRQSAFRSIRDFYERNT